MKPFRIFIFFAAVLFLLALIAFFMPEHGIGINGDVRFRFISLSDVFLGRATPDVSNAERLLELSSVTEDPESDPALISGSAPDSFFSAPSLIAPSEDRRGIPAATDRAGIPAGTPTETATGTLSGTDDVASDAQHMAETEAAPVPGEEDLSASRLPSEGGPGRSAGEVERNGSGKVSGSLREGADGSDRPAVRGANVDSLQRSVYPILFPENGNQVLEPFFSTLNDLREGKIIRTRILHFGDSQIENDRMTALIRFRLQSLFGGTGSGLVQAIPLYSGSMAYHQEQQGEWLRYTYFRNRDTTISHNSFGVMAAFASVPTPTEAGWPMLHYSFNLSRRSGQCDRVKVFMHSYVEGASLVFHVNDTISDTIRNLPAGYSVADYRHVGIIKDLSLALNFPQGGRIYGLSFESYSGLQVDNIALRGSSGLIFSKMDREQQETMLSQLSPSLILLQFGGNVVPYMNPRYYRREFEKELAFFREICPDVPVIVIGPADMSVREKGVFKTYPGLEKIRDALKNAALESGFAFWDLYEAMGGHNSMPSFVHADPPLASSDYVHFNSLGINVVAEMFYNSLMMEYRQHSQQTALQ